MEDRQTVFLIQLARAARLSDVQAVAFLDQFRELEHRRTLLLYQRDALGPVHVLVETQLLQERVVVGIVVQAGEGAEVLVAFDKQSLLVHIGEAPGALHPGAAASATPFRHGIQQGLQHFAVFDEVQPAEADVLLFPDLVGGAVDNGRHAAGQFAVLVGQVALGFAVVVRAVLLLVKSIEFVPAKRGNPVLAAFVKLFREIYETAQIAPGFHNFQFYRHRISFSTTQIYKDFRKFGVCKPKTTFEEKCPTTSTT